MRLFATQEMIDVELCINHDQSARCEHKWCLPRYNEVSVSIVHLLLDQSAVFEVEDAGVKIVHFRWWILFCNESFACLKVSRKSGHIERGENQLDLESPISMSD